MHGYLRDNTSGCCMTLKEKVFVEEENLQDYQKRRDRRGESQEREGPHGEFATKTSGLARKESCGCLRNGLLKMGKEGKVMQSNAKAWYGRLSLPDIF